MMTLSKLGLAFLCLATVSFSLADRQDINSPYPRERRLGLLRRADINFANFPECAKPHCNPSSSLSPSRLGCVESNLTKDCFCKKAVTPLACVPSGPSSEENCWYNVEDWFAGQCGADVPTLSPKTMPSCMADCTTNWLRSEGCRADTRNCFCKLDGRAVTSAAEDCRKSGCMKHMQPKFDAGFWREQICSQGDVDPYDDVAYQKRRKMVKNVQIVVPIFLMLVLVLPLAITGITLCVQDGDDSYCAALTMWVLAICATILVIVPIYVAI